MLIKWVYGSAQNGGPQSQRSRPRFEGKQTQTADDKCEANQGAETEHPHGDSREAETSTVRLIRIAQKRPRDEQIESSTDGEQNKGADDTAA